MSLKPGSRWKSAVDNVEIVVVRPANGDVTLGCGGHPMVPLGEDAPQGLAIDPAFATGTVMGKRYTDATSGVELLCVKGGEGTVSVDGRATELKDAKPLPASD